VCALDGLLRALVRSLGDWRSLFEGAGAEVDLLREPPDKTLESPNMPVLPDSR
jgi:hypothetical protein